MSTDHRISIATSPLSLRVRVREIFASGGIKDGLDVANVYPSALRWAVWQDSS